MVLDKQLSHPVVLAGIEPYYHPLEAHTHVSHHGCPLSGQNLTERQKLSTLVATAAPRPERQATRIPPLAPADGNSTKCAKSEPSVDRTVLLEIAGIFVSWIHTTSTREEQTRV
jgi:hypothetical protein